MLRRGGNEWARFFRERLGIDFDHLCPTSLENWNEFFERRNILIHNDGIADDVYVRRIHGASSDGNDTVLDKPGDTLGVSDDYLFRALTVFFVFGLRIADACGESWNDALQELRSFLLEVVWSEQAYRRWLSSDLLAEYMLERGVEDPGLRARAFVAYCHSQRELDEPDDWRSVVEEEANDVADPIARVELRSLLGDEDGFLSAYQKL